MSKYFNDGISPVPLIADEDLTTWQWKAVQLTASAGFTVQRSTTASNPTPFGVLQNDPSKSSEAAVKAIGFTKAIGRVCNSCWLQPGNYLMAASDGIFEPIGTSTCAATARWVDDRQTTSDGSYVGNIYFYGVPASVVNR
jgi:hypothetical protein